MGGCLETGACEGAGAEVDGLETGFVEGAWLATAFEEPGWSFVDGVAMRFSGREDVVAVLFVFGIAPVPEDWARNACCCLRILIFPRRCSSCGAAGCTGGGSEGRSLSSRTLQEREGCSRVGGCETSEGSRCCGGACCGMVDGSGVIKG